MKRISIEGITPVENRQKALERLADAGEIHEVLIVTTVGRRPISEEELSGFQGRSSVIIDADTGDAHIQ